MQYKYTTGVCFNCFLFCNRFIGCESPMTRSQQSSLDQLILHNPPPHLIPKFVIHPVLKHDFFWVFHTSGNGLLGDRCWFQRCVSPLRGEVNVGPTQVCDPIHVFHVYPFLGKQFLVGGFKHGFYLPFHIWDVIRNPLMNSIIFQRGGSTHQPGCCFF